MRLQGGSGAGVRGQQVPAAGAPSPALAALRFFCHLSDAPPLFPDSPAHTVTCAMDLLAATVHSRAAALPPGLAPRHSERPLRYAAGGVFGDLDFFLQRPRSFVAVVQEGGSAWRFSRAACEGMAAEDPASLALLLTLVLRSTSLSVANMLEVLERSAASDR